MPRRKRRTVPGVVYHLISRFVNHEWMISSDLERTLYLKLLGRAIQQSTWRCLGYALMSNHIHLVVVAGFERLADWIRGVHSPFADALNRSRDRIGPMFVRGPKDILVPDSGTGRVLAYVHNNPVRANVVSDPRHTDWTSHCSYIGASPVPRWLSVAEGLQRAGISRAGFNELVTASAGHPVLGDVESDEHFEELVDAYERQQLALQQAEVELKPPDALRVAAAVAEVMGVRVEQLRSRRRNETERRGRAATIACGARLGCSSTAIAQALGLTSQAVNKHLRSAGLRADVAMLVDAAMLALEQESMNEADARSGEIFDASPSSMT